MKEQLLEKLLTLIEQVVGESEQPNKPEAEVAVVKSVNEMQKKALFVVLEPQDDDGTTADLHGDWYSSEEIEEACANFNIHCRKAGLEHEGLLSSEEVIIEQSYIAPCDFTTETGAFVKKGSWLQMWKFKSDELWAGVLDGTYTGVSIECSATGYGVE